MFLWTPMFARKSVDSQFYIPQSVVVLYHVTIVAIGHGLLKKCRPMIGNKLHSIRVGKNPGFFEKTQPTRVFRVFYRNFGISFHPINLRFSRQRHTNFLFRNQPLYPPSPRWGGGGWAKGKKLSKEEETVRRYLVKFWRKKCFLEQDGNWGGGGCLWNIFPCSAVRLLGLIIMYFSLQFQRQKTTIIKWIHAWTVQFNELPIARMH